MSCIHILVAVPEPLRGQILTSYALSRLQAMSKVTLNDDGHNWTSEELASRLTGVDVLITGWGIARLDAATLAQADRLRLVAHAAGSVRGFVTEAVFDRGIAVTHAAGRIAHSVAEFTLLVTMMGLRRPQDLGQRMKNGELWPASERLTYEIQGKRVGLLGMGYVGRRTASIFRAVGAEVWAYDPYLSAEQAEVLGVRKAELDEVLSQCAVISVHLPATDETHHLIGARELALLQDGAVFVNSARAYTVDQEALINELATGRFWAALDVFDPEPLPIDSPLRHMDNVLLTPHIAGATVDSLQGMMNTVVDEVERFLRGESLQYSVSRETLARMA